MAPPSPVDDEDDDEDVEYEEVEVEVTDDEDDNIEEEIIYEGRKVARKNILFASCLVERDLSLWSWRFFIYDKGGHEMKP